MEERSSDAFEAFYLAHFDRVARAAYVVVGVAEDAFDIAQESFARTWESWDKLMERDDPLFFTLRVAANLSSSHLRRVITLRRLLAFLRGGNTIEHTADRTDTLAVRSALAALPVQQRWAAVLCDMLGYRSEPAASILGIRPSTLRVHLARARATLRGALADSPDQSLEQRAPVSEKSPGGDPGG